MSSISPGSTPRWSGHPRAQDIRPGELAILSQAYESQVADQSDFYASTNETEREDLNNTVSGTPENGAAFQETLAQEIAAQNPVTPLTAHGSGLNARSHHPLTDWTTSS
jgi:hypothetical protein